MSACTPNLRARRPTMISRCRSPSPRISVCCSSPLYSCWNVGSSSCSLCSPFESFSSSPRCFTSMASVITGSGKGILRRTIGCSFVDSVSLVCVSRSFATTPLSPHGRTLARHGKELHQLREQRARPVGQLGGAAEQGEQLALRHSRLHRGDRLVASDFLAPQVALEQRVVRFRDALDQLLRVPLEAVPVLRGHVDLLVLAGLRPLLVQVALLREEIDDTVELRALFE